MYFIIYQRIHIHVFNSINNKNFLRLTNEDAHTTTTQEEEQEEYQESQN